MYTHATGNTSDSAPRVTSRVMIPRSMTCPTLRSGWSGRTGGTEPESSAAPSERAGMSTGATKARRATGSH